MQQWPLEQIGGPQEIFRSPRSRFVAEFVGRNNILPGQAPGQEIVVAADKMQVSATAPEGQALKADFLSEEFAGTSIICYFEGENGEELKAQVTEDALARLAPEPGQTFWLSWAPEAAHVMEKA